MQAKLGSLASMVYYAASWGRKIIANKKKFRKILNNRTKNLFGYLQKVNIIMIESLNNELRYLLIEYANIQNALN